MTVKPELEHVLKIAIASEIMARNRYASLAGTIEDEEARSLLLTLSEQEEGHRATLMSLYGRLFPGREPGLDVQAIDEVGEMPVNLESLIQMAIDEEARAATLYDNLASEASTDGNVEVGKLLAGLAGMERKHGRTLESIREMMGMAEGALSPEGTHQTHNEQSGSSIQ